MEQYAASAPVIFQLVSGRNRSGKIAANDERKRAIFLLIRHTLASLFLWRGVKGHLVA